MTSRTLLAQSAPFGNTGGSASTAFGAVDIPAGSLCLVSFRSETSAIDITGTDTAGGTWTFVDTNTSGQINAVIGYSWNHPGGTGVVLTINAVLSGTSTPYSNSYRYGRVHVLSGGDTVDPYVGASLVTQSTGPMDLTVNFTGAGSVLAVQSDYSPASYTPQNGGTLVDSSSYYGAILFTGVTNTANPKFNSTSGSCACIAVAFLDVPGGADVSPPAATGPLTVSNSLPTSYRISGFSAVDNVAVTGWRWRVNAGAWTEFTGTFFDVTGRTTNATDTIEVQARDAVPNWSNTLSKSVLVGAQIVTISALHFYPNGAANSNVALNMPGLPRTNHTFIWKSKRGRGAGEGSASQANGYGAEAWHISRAGPWENDIAFAFGTHPYPAPTPGTYDADGERTGVWSGIGPHYSEIAGLKNFGSTGRDFISSPVSIVGSGNQASYLVDETDTVWVTNARQSYVLPDGLTLRHKYYVDLENDPTKVIIQDIALSSISEQDATQNDRGFSFGAPPWTESGSANSETPRGKHYYFKGFSDGQMSVADMVAEAQSYSDSAVTAAGIASEHFSSINLTVADITDKSGNGNHLSWRTVYRPLDYSEDVEIAASPVWEDLPGETGTSYTTPPLTADMNGWQYRWVATNPYGSATTTAATQTVTGGGASGTATPGGVAASAAVGSLSAIGAGRALPAGVQAAASVGAASATGGTFIPATATPAGVVAVGAAGSATATGAGLALPAGVQAAAAVGVASATGGVFIPATATPAGVVAVVAAGTGAATGAALVLTPGVQASSAVGAASAAGGVFIPATATPAGVASVAAAGSATATGAALALPAGVQAAAAVGTATAAGGVFVPATAVPAGVSAAAAVGSAVAQGAAITTPAGVQALASVGAAAATGGAFIPATAMPAGVAAVAGYVGAFDIVARGEAWVVPSGVQAVAAVGAVLAYGDAGPVLPWPVGRATLTHLAIVPFTGVRAVLPGADVHAIVQFNGVRAIVTAETSTP